MLRAAAMTAVVAVAAVCLPISKAMAQTAPFPVAPVIQQQAQLDHLFFLDGMWSLDTKGLSLVQPGKTGFMINSLAMQFRPVRVPYTGSKPDLNLLTSQVARYAQDQDRGYQPVAQPVALTADNSLVLLVTSKPFPALGSNQNVGVIFAWASLSDAGNGKPGLGWVPVAYRIWQFGAGVNIFTPGPNFSRPMALFSTTGRRDQIVDKQGIREFVGLVASNSADVRRRIGDVQSVSVDTGTWNTGFGPNGQPTGVDTQTSTARISGRGGEAQAQFALNAYMLTPHVIYLGTTQYGLAR